MSWRCDPEAKMLLMLKKLFLSQIWPSKQLSYDFVWGQSSGVYLQARWGYVFTSAIISGMFSNIAAKIS